MRGIKQSSLVVNALTIGKVLPLVGLHRRGPLVRRPGALAVMPAVTPEQFGVAALLLIFAFGGYEVTGVLAGEAANPKRDVPFAFVMTLMIVVTVMSLTSIVATGVLPELAQSKTPLADGAALFLGAAGARWSRSARRCR